ncbi:DMT family transporter [Euryarchaeota archaeon]|mgnify:CR=1 FL=1|nr:DMT family transporter [Euryarchaeota archaeon]
MSYRENLSTHILLLMVAAIWGSTWAIGRFLSYGIDDANRASMGPATSAWLRYVFAVFAFAAWCWIYRNKGGPRILPRERNAWKYTFWMALLGTMGYQLLFMNGMKWTAAGDASLIIPVNPVFTVLLAVPMLGQRLSSRMVLGLLFGLAGVATVVGWSPNTDIPFEHRLIGDVMIALAALTWAATSNLTKMALSEGTVGTPLEIVVWYSIVGWVLLTPWMLIEVWSTGVPVPSSAEWASVAYLGLVSTVLTYAWFARGIDRIGTTAAASYVFLVPVFGVLSGWLMLGESIGVSMLVGFCLIVIGVREVQRESEKLSS